MKIIIEMDDGRHIEHQCKVMMFRKVFGGYLFSDGEKDTDANFQVPENCVVGLIVEDDDYEAVEHGVQRASGCTCDILSVMGGVMIEYKKDCPVASHAANANRWAALAQ